MPIRKSIRDIQTSNTISDMVSVEPVKKTRVKKTVQVAEAYSEPESIQKNEDTEDPFMPSDVSVDQIPQETPKTTTTPAYKKIIKTLAQIKTIYLIAFGIIILGVVILIFTLSSSKKDPLEQTYKEAESVKKQFSKHIILPQNEQIDIRKITSKMDDPFFKDAEIGDYLIIFYKNRIAYIYSVDKDIIINAGVVFIDPKTATTTSSTTKKQ